MSGCLVISLDFELMWGVRDHRTVSTYGDAVLGVRKALPRLLQKFDIYDIHATWATVGLLFARNRTEMLDYFPSARPNYFKKELSPFQAIKSEIGADEASDPYHYGRSLVEQVLQTSRHEIATHTYSHYYCLEDGQNLDAFESDLRAAIEISASAGVRPTSIVFPRNQMTEDHVKACARHGINAFRGNPDSFAYRPRSKAENNALVKGIRLADACFPLTGRHSYRAALNIEGCYDIQASRFFRPYSPRMGILNDLHVSRIISEMELAARRGEIYHLWWHPHNFGRHTDVQINRLDLILQAYRRLNNTQGMRSMTMRECAEKSIAHF